MIQKRDIAMAVVLSIITCGIYGIYWFVTITDDVKTAAHDNDFQSGGTAVLLTLITCGIYGIYWAYKMGELVKVAQEENDVPVKDNAILYLILEIFGLGIVNFALIQNELNTIATKGA